MTTDLFQTNPQHRESKVIKTIFETLPLYDKLLGGSIFRWFAINIPMQLVGSHPYKSDIDIIGSFYYQRTNQIFYRTWEVKVSLLLAGGGAKSLKAGKTNSIFNQLKAYSGFGVPHVELLDVYLCEESYFKNNIFPSKEVSEVVHERIARLKGSGFGYSLIPMEFRTNDFTELLELSQLNIIFTNKWSMLEPSIVEPSAPFMQLTEYLENYVEEEKKTTSLAGLIIHCPQCKHLSYIKRRDPFVCRNCGFNLAT